MGTLPRWLEALKTDSKLLAKGLRWFSPEEAEAARSQALADGDDTPLRERLHLPEALFAKAREQLTGSVPVAAGPVVTDRLGVAHPSVFWAGLTGLAARELKLALSPQHPPLFWISAGATTASITEALESAIRSGRPSDVELTGHHRFFIGTNADGLDLVALDHRFAASPFLDPVAYGSAQESEPADKPLPRGPRRAELLRELKTQAPSAAAHPWLRFRTAFSRSLLTVEGHLGIGANLNIYVLELRYRPARQTALVQHLNQTLNQTLPEDLPVDLAGALVGLRLDPAERIREVLADAPLPSLHFALMCLSALAPDAEAAEEDLGPYADHPEESVRRVVAHLAERRRLGGLLRTMASAESVPALREELGRAVTHVAP